MVNKTEQTYAQKCWLVPFKGLVLARFHGDVPLLAEESGGHFLVETEIHADVYGVILGEVIVRAKVHEIVTIGRGGQAGKSVFTH